MIVTSIHALDKRRCKVVFEEGLALVLYRGEIRRYQIEEGKELMEAVYQEILTQILFKRARERVLYLLKSMDRTEEEIRRKLRDGCYPQEVINYAVDYAKQYRYINDENYCRNYVHTYGEKKSRRQIAYDMQQKGLDRELIEEALEELPDEEEAQIRKLLKKRGFCADTADWQEKKKQASYLMRKGFAYENIQRAMNEEQLY